MRILSNTINLGISESGPFAQELLSDHQLGIEKALGGPPAGTFFCIVEEEHLHICYLPNSTESMEYVLEVLEYVDK